MPTILISPLLTSAGNFQNLPLGESVNRNFHIKARPFDPKGRTMNPKGGNFDLKGRNFDPYRSKTSPQR
ncbi:MAG TPA: hypothetical protein VK184_17225 [Nostocaceae cyanobacterium]|nr:hypothetical protein [Nostocaceae cyanobacterium]